MNLSKVKRKATGALLLGMMVTSVAGAVMPVYAAEENAIGIEKPAGWKQGATTITVTLNTDKLGEGITITKLEAKVGENGSWADITDSHTISIDQNETVYVRATDSEGNVYEQNRSIKCYDSEKPTLAASLKDGVLTIQGKDTISGIVCITVNGTEYRDLTDGTLKIQLTQKDFTTKKIEITATDAAGNVSETYSLQNPYYEWAVKQAIAQSADASGGSTTTTQTGGEQQVTSPLPQDATPSEPTSSTGTVEDRTVTGIEQELAQQNETVDKISSTTTAAGKEFYTISTKSGKVFYLVIDNEQSQDNVYFLTEVDEQDLMNFTLSDTVTLPDVDTVYATVEEEPQAETPVTEGETTQETEAPEKPEEEKPEKSGKLASYLLIGLIAAGVGAGAWYMKVYKPKHEYDEGDEYEEPEEDEPVTYEKDEVDSAYASEEPEIMEDEED
ncbi:MAG: DUF4366 domain-containing protein [Eubacteriales bacterium]|nr:DUF4366 domain-containing protein [Eubacteriales bacterium]